MILRYLGVAPNIATQIHTQSDIIEPKRSSFFGEFRNDNHFVQQALILSLNMMYKLALYPARIKLRIIFLFPFATPRLK